MHDLLNDPLISARLPDGERRLSLPELMTELAAGRVLAYTRMRRHQVEPFHVMTTQLAVGVMIQQRLASAPEQAVAWREGLLRLAGGMPSAWHLIERDPCKPAFLQSPCATARDFDAYKPKAFCPDELDVPITAKNHDVKRARARGDDIELWLHAMVVLQTTGRYSIHYQSSARMNSNFGSRAVVSIASDARPGPRFREEVSLVLRHRENVLRKRSYGYTGSGTILTWLRPRPLKQSQFLSLRELDPLFVEVVRPLRLCESSGLITAHMASDVPNQIGACRGNFHNGDTGDPWTVLSLKGKKKPTAALTVTGPLTPELLTDLLFSADYERTLLQSPRAGQGRIYLNVSALASGGQTKTNGFREATIPIPEKARALLCRAQTYETLATLAKKLLADASKIEKECLRPALVVLFHSSEVGKTEKNRESKTVNKWVSREAERFAEQWHLDYFPVLWEGSEFLSDPDRVSGLSMHWQQRLCDCARRILANAELRLPAGLSRRLRAAAIARNRLEDKLQQYFPFRRTTNGMYQ